MNNLYSYNTILYQRTACPQQTAMYLNAAALMLTWNTQFI